MKNSLALFTWAILTGNRFVNIAFLSTISFLRIKRKSTSHIHSPDSKDKEKLLLGDFYVKIIFLQLALDLDKISIECCIKVPCTVTGNVIHNISMLSLTLQRYADFQG